MELWGKLGRERVRVGYHRVSIERRRHDDREKDTGVVATLPAVVANVSDGRSGLQSSDFRGARSPGSRQERRERVLGTTFKADHDQES